MKVVPLCKNGGKHGGIPIHLNPQYSDGNACENSSDPDITAYEMQFDQCALLPTVLLK